MVRLKAYFFIPIALNMSNFNSTMVRLKEARNVRYNKAATHFNSTMVRLKEVGKLEGVVFDNISIPLWFG